MGDTSIGWLNGRLKWIEESRGCYLCIDFTDLVDAEALDLVFQSQKVIEKEKLESVLVFVDVTNICISTNSLSNFRKVSKTCQKYIDKSGLVGMSTFGKTLFPMYKAITKTKVEVFTSKEKAIEYLFS